MLSIYNDNNKLFSDGFSFFQIIPSATADKFQLFNCCMIWNLQGMLTPDEL